MLGQVLPQLQTFIEENCTGGGGGGGREGGRDREQYFTDKLRYLDILRLPIPEIIYSRYTGDETTDVFVMENLLSAGFEPYKEGNLVEENLKSCLECLAQLHGTGLAYKASLFTVDLPLC